jgi:hypothetical protein
MQTQIYHRYLTDDERKARALILMGATYPTLSYMDIDTAEDSFGDMLADRGVEWWTYDMFGTSRPNAKLPFGDTHAANVDLAERLIRENDIDYVMGYSYSVLIVKELIDRNVPIKKAFFWDCWAATNVRFDSDDGDKKQLDKVAYLKALRDHDLNMSPRILKDHIDHMFYPGEGNKRYFPSSPDLLSKTHAQTGPSDIAALHERLPIKVAFSKHSKPQTRELFRPEDSLYYEDVAHWIWLEDGRRRLVDDFYDFIISVTE